MSSVPSTRAYESVVPGIRVPRKGMKAGVGTYRSEGNSTPLKSLVEINVIKVIGISLSYNAPSGKSVIL
ncbi:hypothetical protein N7468_000992 [Penicillium chermesinum]|uniref:Uncharacterized protein n=1 Tax=Penicillium chermesinum TaxID=63820 RepID=A0A9W9TY75_9EURO|nr:uncharacterized protein N7468_000992 [Penicillium chermesinum]KAJ5246009.1 hypothetical protein N7468_000992 [Penicillium chermesinum]KAJ6144306.1 hypothetical protein N7470_008201 [Penicillium chermesinum]